MPLPPGVSVCERRRWRMQRAISSVPRSKFAEREREKRISGTANGVSAKPTERAPRNMPCKRDQKNNLPKVEKVLDKVGSPWYNGFNLEEGWRRPFAG